MNVHLSSLFLLLSLVASTLPTTAQVTTTQSVSIGPNLTNHDTPVTLNKFSGSIDSLQSIRLSYELTVKEGSLILDNDSGGQTRNLDADFGATLTLTSTNIELTDIFSNRIPQAHATNAFNNISLLPDEGVEALFDFNPESPDGAMLSGGTVTDAKSVELHPSLYGHFVGTGTFTFDAKTEHHLDLVGDTGYAWLYNPLLSEGKVSIEFTTVPEPTSTFILAAFSMALFLRRRRFILVT